MLHRFFEIIEQVGLTAYRLAFYQTLSWVYNEFYVLIFQKYIGDLMHVIQFSPMEFKEYMWYDD